MNKPYYTVTNWAEGAYRITSMEAVYADLLVGREKALLLDTGWGLGNLYETVQEITDKPLVVVNSHGHVDHVNGNTWFQEDIYIHPRDMALCREHSSPQMRCFILSLFQQDSSMQLPSQLDITSYEKGGTGHLIPVEEGAQFDLGGKTLKVVELPGHTAGSIGLLCQEMGTFFVGDAINGALALNRQESMNLSTYIHTLEKAETIDFDSMIQSHVGQPVKKEMLSIYLETAENANWKEAGAYVEDGKVNPGTRVVCRPGMTPQDWEQPGFACILLAKDKLE